LNFKDLAHVSDILKTEQAQQNLERCRTIVFRSQ